MLRIEQSETISQCGAVIVASGGYINIEEGRSIMKALSRFFTVIILVWPILLLASCAQESRVTPVPAGEMEEYKDPAFRFSIAYPKQWIPNLQVGLAHFYSAEGVDIKFRDPAGSHPLGAVISVRVRQSDDHVSTKEEFKQELIATGSTLEKEQRTKVGEYDAIRFRYSAPAGPNMIYGHHVLISSGPTLYDIGFAGFDDHYEAHRAVFDAALNSFSIQQ